MLQAVARAVKLLLRAEVNPAYRFLPESPELERFNRQVAHAGERFCYRIGVRLPHEKQRLLPMYRNFERTLRAGHP
jgi:hypothetical protein